MRTLRKKALSHVVAQAATRFIESLQEGDYVGYGRRLKEYSGYSERALEAVAVGFAEFMFVGTGV